MGATMKGESVIFGIDLLWHPPPCVLVVWNVQVVRHITVRRASGIHKNRKHRHRVVSRERVEWIPGDVPALTELSCEPQYTRRTEQGNVQSQHRGIVLGAFWFGIA